MKVLIFGANSPIGQNVSKFACEKGLSVVKIVTPWSYQFPYHGDCDCLNFEDVLYQLRTWTPDYVVSLAGFNGNLELNQTKPADICGITAKCNLNIIQACTTLKIKKVLIPLSSCSYSSDESVWKEENYLKGEIHPSVIAHGYSRRFIYVLGQQFNRQYGNRFIFPIINNGFGPEDPWCKPIKLKVFGSLIQKIVNAKLEGKSEIDLWGTGVARREGCYFAEAGRLIVEMLLKYEDYSLPLNIGCGEDLSIKELAALIQDTCCWQGKINWDTTKPEGQMKKLLDVSRANSLGLIYQGNLREQIINTVRYYEYVFRY